MLPLILWAGKKGSRYILTYVCFASHWPEAVALKSVTAHTVAEALVEIFTHCGFPLTILSDRGTQFTGCVMKELAEAFHIHLKHTTPYHPQTNGALERLHGTLEAVLLKLANMGWTGSLFFT